MAPASETLPDVAVDTAERSLRVACKSVGVPEIFLSVQGEGRSLGQLRSFLRLSGCNLQCYWCDTPYTWNWEGTDWPHIDDAGSKPAKYLQSQESVDMRFDAIAATIAELGAEGLVITGGEPLVQMSGLTSLIRLLKTGEPQLVVEIETNGTIAPSPELAGLVDLFMVSPKLDHAANRPGSALRPTALRAFADLESAFFKFVAETRDDIETVKQLTSDYGVAPRRVYIMPLGTRSADIIRIGGDLIESVIGHGFNYSDRLHIHLFGDKRGT